MNPLIQRLCREGMVDISVVGDVFAARPAPRPAWTPLRWRTRTKGVLYIVLNHAGDMLTGSLTMKQVVQKGPPTRVIKVVTQEGCGQRPSGEQR